MSLDASALDAILTEAVATGALPAAAVIVVDRDGDLYSGAVGVQPDAIFRYASLTKAVASVAALQLIEQGRLSLDDEVGMHLPEFAKVQVLEPDAPAVEEPAVEAPAVEAPPDL